MVSYFKWAIISQKPAFLHKPSARYYLCSFLNREQIELLQLDRGEIRVAEYLVELPPQGDAGGQAGT